MQITSQRTVAILSQQKQDMTKIQEMDRRARKYCVERQIGKQVKRLMNASMNNEHSHGDTLNQRKQGVIHSGGTVVL